MNDLVETHAQAYKLLSETFSLKGLMGDDHLFIVLRCTHSRKPLGVATVKQEKQNPRMMTINFFVTAKQFRFARFSQPFLDLLLKLGPGPPKVGGQSAGVGNSFAF